MKNLQLNIAFIKLELMVRQSLYFGQTIQQNFEPVVTQQIMGSFIKDTCEIILSTIDRKKVNPIVDDHLLNALHTACCHELGSLYHSLELLTGLPPEAAAPKIEARIREAAMRMAITLKMLLANPKAIILVP